MVRNYKKTGDKVISQDVMNEACQNVLENGRSVNSVAKEFNLNVSSLWRYVKKLKTSNINEVQKVGYKPANKVFTEEQEEELVNYIVKAASLFYGLTIKDIRKLGYQCAKLKNYDYPSKWDENGLAGIDWYYGFMKRHSNLSLRSPQATSLSRATSFNRHNVEEFFKNLEKVFTDHHFEPQNIHNLDETGITTVHRPNKIVTLKGSKSVGAFTSGERGTLVTVCLAVNALGNSTPPLFIFPRKIYRDHFIQGAPFGSIGSSSSSGWMNEDIFFTFIQHFAKHSGATPENKVLLLLDNHESHLSIPVIDFCKSNGIIMLTFPPHTSHKLQPLDRSVYGPLKKYVNSFSDIWMKKNPGKPMTIYDIPGIVKEALPQAISPSNIMAGFKCTGIYPFNKNVFVDSEFMPSYVTDRPLPELTQNSNGPIESNAQTQVSQVETNPQMTSSDAPTTSKSLNIENHFPFVKAEPRKKTNRGRKKLKSAILTDSPIRNEIQERKLATKASKAKKIQPTTPKKKILKKNPRKLF